MQEQLGHRQFVQRTTRHVIRTVVYRGVLDETSTKGHYRQEPPYHVGDEDVAAWLLEAALRAQGAESVRLQALPTTQQLFPFRLATPSLTRLVERLHLELFRQGGNEDVVILRC
jgi:hypothetical protein